MPTKAKRLSGQTGTLAVSTQAQQALGLRLATVQRQTIGAAIEAVGTVQLNDRDVSIVQARSAGFVERVYARAPGDVVAAGAPLVDLLIPEWLGAQQEYLAVKATGDAALTQAARSRLRAAGHAGVADRACRALGTGRLRCTPSPRPRAACITELMVRQGMSVAPGMTLARINGLSTVWLEAALPESLAATIQPGQAVEARFPALPGEVIKGKVAAVLPEANRDTRTLRLRIELPNPGQRLKAGMFAQVSLRGSGARGAGGAGGSGDPHRQARAGVSWRSSPDATARWKCKSASRSTSGSSFAAAWSPGSRWWPQGQFLIDSEASLQGVMARGSPGASSAAPQRRPPPPPSIAPAGVIVEIEPGSLTLEHAAVPALNGRR